MQYTSGSARLFNNSLVASIAGHVTRFTDKKKKKELRQLIMKPRDTVKSHFKALGLYNLKRVFGWAYERGGGGLYPGGLISGIEKMFRNDERKRICETN